MDKTPDRPVITWTPAKLREFTWTYKMAVRQHEEVFTWDGYDFVTSYAKYLIEFLNHRFDRKETV
jgi:hypothetical protein